MHTLIVCVLICMQMYLCPSVPNIQRWKEGAERVLRNRDSISARRSTPMCTSIFGGRGLQSCSACVWSVRSFRKHWYGQFSRSFSSQTFNMRVSLPMPKCIELMRYTQVNPLFVSHIYIYIYIQHTHSMYVYIYIYIYTHKHELLNIDRRALRLGRTRGT